MASFDMAMSGQTSQPKQKSYSKVLHTKRAIRGLICILFCLLSLLPFLLMVMNATRTSGDIQAGVSLIPSSHLMENWNMLLQKQNGMRLTLGRAMLNSLCITVPGTFLAVYCSCMTAYGIHVYNFKAKKFAWVRGYNQPDPEPITSALPEAVLLRSHSSHSHPSFYP